MREIIGAIYPVPISLVDRFFDGKHRVFVKYVAHNSTNLAPKHKLILYASHGPKRLVGEGVIEKVGFLTPAQVIFSYEEELFLTREELDVYSRSGSRTASKEMLTLVLTKLRRYPKPINYNKPITMGGNT